MAQVTFRIDDAGNYILAGNVDRVFTRGTIFIRRNGSDLAVLDGDGSIKNPFRRDDLSAFHYEVNFVRHFASFLMLFFRKWASVGTNGRGADGVEKNEYNLILINVF